MKPLALILGAVCGCALVVALSFYALNFTVGVYWPEDTSRKDNFSNYDYYDEASSEYVSFENDAVNENYTYFNDPLVDKKITRASSNNQRFFVRGVKVRKCQQGGIYVDRIYNPGYTNQLTILKTILTEIIERNPQMGFFYDNEHSPNSTLVTVGFEHVSMRLQERQVILVKPKLLKDILYTENVFQQVYRFLFDFFRHCVNDPTQVPEHDEHISLTRYRQRFVKEMRVVDNSLREAIACREQLMHLAIRPDQRYMRQLAFVDQDTAYYWQTLLSRVSYFMEELLVGTLQMNRCDPNYLSSCYEVLLRPETDARQVLLFPHKAVKRVDPGDKRAFDLNHLSEIRHDIILFKHRVLHALGLPHRYTKASVMTSYEKKHQNAVLFQITGDDRRALAVCYPLRTGQCNARYVNADFESELSANSTSLLADGLAKSESLLRAFVKTSFGEFQKMYTTCDKMSPDFRF